MNAQALGVLVAFALIGFAAGQAYERGRTERLELMRELDALRARLPAAAVVPEPEKAEAAT